MTRLSGLRLFLNLYKRPFRILRGHKFSFDLRFWSLSLDIEQSIAWKLVLKLIEFGLNFPWIESKVHSHWMGPLYKTFWSILNEHMRVLLDSQILFLSLFLFTTPVLGKINAVSFPNIKSQALFLLLQLRVKVQLGALSKGQFWFTSILRILKAL